MKRKLFTALIGIAALAALSLGVAAAAPRDQPAGGNTYRVTITNLTRGQPLSPVVVATHTGELAPLLTLGQPASPELAALAEDADNAPLNTLWDPASNPDVNDLQTITGANGPILPGETASAEVSVMGRSRHLSLASMLVNTNDAFAAINGIELPKNGVRVIWSPAYDAGSEANNEDCGFIPGPACGSAFVRDTDDAEGYVHVHAGIHGIADLDPAAYDWRNPVAYITITRVP